MLKKSICPLLALMVIVLTVPACGSLQVDVVTPTPEADLAPTSATQEVEVKAATPNKDIARTEADPSPEKAEESPEVVIDGTEEQPEIEAAYDPAADWPVFVNERYGYQFSYPQEATITLHGPDGFPSDDLPAGMTPEQYMDELSKTYTDHLCVGVHYALGVIYISAPPNTKKFYTPCGPTGVGAGEIIDKVGSIYVGEQLYDANGMEILLEVSDGAGGMVQGETLDMHSEMFYIMLKDGTRIYFGSVPRDDATYEDYLAKTRDVLLQIISTYQVVP